MLQSKIDDADVAARLLTGSFISQSNIFVGFKTI